MRFARFVLIVQAVIMAGISLIYWLRPYEMANLNGMVLMESASVSHMRVYYGGLQLGLALFIAWSVLVPERVRSALVMLVFILLALVLGRLVSLWLDGGELTGFDLLSLVCRGLAALLSVAAWWVIREKPEPERIAPPTRRLHDAAPGPFRLGESKEGIDNQGVEAMVKPFRKGPAASK